jgi:transposase
MVGAYPRRSLPKETLMASSIATESWQVNANDPLALTYLLDLPEFTVTGLEYDAHVDLLLVWCHPRHDLAVCSTCDTVSAQVHDSKERWVRDLPWAGKRCALVLPVRRFKCASCRRPFTERLESVAPLARYTRRYEHYLFEQCRGTTIQAVHRREGLGYKAVEGVYYRLATQRHGAPILQTVRRLGIDEIALKKGHGQYVLVLSDLDRGCVITVLPERTKAALEAYLATWTAEQRGAITDVALDLWEPYHLAVRACLPNAQITADRFHVMQNLNDRVTEARRTIQRSAPKEEKAQLKGCRWLLVKNADDLTVEEQATLEAMFVASPALQRLHELKEAFRSVFETAPDRPSAQEQLTDWVQEIEQSGVSGLTKFVTTLRNWWEVILNYFHDRLTSGMVEGLNNKLKLIKRLAYGYRNFEHFRLRVLIECDGGIESH